MQVHVQVEEVGEHVHHVEAEGVVVHVRVGETGDHVHNVEVEDVEVHVHGEVHEDGQEAVLVVLGALIVSVQGGEWQEVQVDVVVDEGSEDSHQLLHSHHSLLF